MIIAYWDRGPWRRDLGVAADRGRFYTVMRALDLNPPSTDEEVYRDGRKVGGGVHRLETWVSERRRAWRDFSAAIEQVGGVLPVHVTNGR